MRKVKTSLAGSKYVGTLAKGCELCIKGLKSVLFVTGICPVNCFYCPLSSYRKNKDITVINEIHVRSDEDIIKEVELCQSRGVGVTGGDPLVRLERTLHYIKLLKDTFGRSFHIHLYTYGILNEEKFRDALSKLEDAGLDELRFHLDMENKRNWPLVKIAVEYSFDVGVEIPCIPDKEDYIKEMVHYLEDIGAKFINLNEFEASELTADEIMARGYELNFDEFNTVKGSYELGRKIMKYISAYTTNLSAHFCESYVKEYFQLRNRFKLRAESMKRPYERVSDEGWLLKAYIYPKERQELEQLKDELMRVLRASPRNFYVNSDRGVVETSEKLGYKAAHHGYKVELVLELPADDRFIMQVDPLYEVEGDEERCC